MALIKVYKPLEHHHESSSKNHILIRLAYAKGLTGITITWHPAASRTRGYVLESNEIKWMRLGGCLESAKEKMNAINMEKKYGNCPHCSAPCEVIEKVDVQNCDGDIFEVPYDVYNYHPQPGPAWVKAKDRLPGWNQPVKWRLDIGAGTNRKIALSEMNDNGVKDILVWQWLDESATAAAPISQDAHEKEVMMQAFDNVRQIFEGREWIMEGRGGYPYNDDRYKEEVRYMYNEFNNIVDDTWGNIESKSADYRKAIIEEHMNGTAANELQELRLWKMEAVEALTPISAYAHKHLECKVGDRYTDLVLAELDRLKLLVERINRKAVHGRPTDLGMGTKQAQMLAEIEDLITSEVSTPAAGREESDALSFADWANSNYLKCGSEMKWASRIGNCHEMFTTGQLYQLFKEQKEKP